MKNTRHRILSALATANAVAIAIGVATAALPVAAATQATGQAVPAPGQPPAAAPALQDLAGSPENFEQYRGRMLVLNFWATWCVPCRKEMPELDRLAAHVDAKRVAVLGVAADDPAAVKAFVSKIGVHYPIATAELDSAIAWSVSLGNRNQGLPFTVLLDAQGRVLWQKSGGQLTEHEVSAVIAKFSAAHKPT